MALLGLPDRHQPLWVFVGHRAIQNGVEYAEDGAVGPDSQRQGQHDHGEEAGTFAHLTNCVANVLQQSVHRSLTSSLVWQLPTLPNTTSLRGAIHRSIRPATRPLDRDRLPSVPANSSPGRPSPGAALT